MIADILAHAIAYEAARSDIECNCTQVESGPPDWYDTASASAEFWIDRAITYLDGRGLLLRHPTNPGWVAIEDAPADPSTIAALLKDRDALREALAAVTATLEWQAHGICRATDGPILNSADAVAMGKAALANHNGGTNGSSARTGS